MNILRRIIFWLPGGQSLGGPYLIALSLLIALFWATTINAVAQESEIPTLPPDAETGQPIHAERCANCHGPLGQGDGELAPNLPNPPAAHGSAEYLRTAVPVEMFNTITDGRIPQGMPTDGI
jgi:mono/diheme cytochrome c family protein